MKYRLEIYAPGSTAAESMASFESDSPFPAITVGNLINPGVWPHDDAQTFMNKGWELIRVVNVLNLIGKAAGTRGEHLCTSQLYTEAALDAVGALTTPRK